MGSAGRGGRVSALAAASRARSERPPGLLRSLLFVGQEPRAAGPAASSAQSLTRPRSGGSFWRLWW